MTPFRRAVEARDFAAVDALLADEVVFTSPVAFAPYRGRAITSAILRNVIEVLEDFRYVREIGAEGASDHALVFEATVSGKQVTGCDFVHTDEAGQVDDLMVMVRPLSAAQALAEAMGARFDRIREQAGS